jgi:hypothetical protein
MDTDRRFSVSVACLLAYGLWVGALVLLIVAAAVESHPLGWFGLATSAAAATATVRMYLIRLHRMLRNAFELGQDSVRLLR